ncbi:hypothetical protein OKW29_000231 [Paraburkholderia sp. CI3]
MVASKFAEFFKITLTEHWRAGDLTYEELSTNANTSPASNQIPISRIRRCKIGWEQRKSLTYQFKLPNPLFLQTFQHYRALGLEPLLY